MSDRQQVLIDRAVPQSLVEHIERTKPDWIDYRALDRSDADFDDAFRAATVVLHVLDPISAADIAGAADLRLIQKFGAGVNTIDRVAAADAGVTVANMPGVNAPSVIEHTVALLLAVLRRLPAQHAGTVSSTAWPGGPNAPAPATEISGSRVGLLGYGAIGQGVERALSALGAEVVHHTRRAGEPGWVSLDELVTTSDIISLHLPLTDDTHHLLNAERIRSMKPGAVIVNTGRGPLIDQSAMVDALASGHLGGAGLDVFDPEPPAVDDPILQLPNVVVTPHTAWFSHGTLRRCWDRALENCERLRDGRPLLDVVAPD